MATKLNFKIVIAAVILGMLAHVYEAKQWNAVKKMGQIFNEDGCTITKNQSDLIIECTPNRYNSGLKFIDGNLRQGSWFIPDLLKTGTHLVQNQNTEDIFLTFVEENEFVIQKKGNDSIIIAGNEPSNLKFVIRKVPDGFYVFPTNSLIYTLYWECDKNGVSKFYTIDKNKFVVEKKGNNFDFVYGNHSNILKILHNNIPDNFYILPGDVEIGEYFIKVINTRKDVVLILIPKGSFVIKKTGQKWELLTGSIPNGIQMVKEGIPDGAYISSKEIEKASVVYGKNLETGLRVILGHKTTH